MGEILMYTLAPGKITGTTWNLDADARRYLTDEYNRKPLLGGWFGKNTTGNPEVIIKAKPDIVLSVGYLNNTDISSAERIQKQLGIPVVMVDGRLSSVDTAYRFVGALVGEAARADTLARYCRETLDRVTAVAAAVPPQERVRVYYAEGLNGLETDPKGSMHAEVLEVAGGINVADVPQAGAFGRAAVSFEQLLLWKPQTIIVQLDRGYADGTGNYARITANPAWRNLDAVKQGRVYEIPSLPFGWFDRPPCVNRMIGLRWLANLLYPDRMKLDIRAEAKQFYALFYHKKLSESECEELLDHALAH
jgi:iron complex transport system substrate-binding protein